MSNTAPNFNGTLADTASYVQGAGGPANTLHGASPAIILDPDAAVVDAELAAINDYNGAALRIYREGGASADDHFYFTNFYQAGSYNLTVTQSAGVLDVAFGAGATQADVNYVMQHISYINAAGDPPASVNLVWEFRDGNGGGQGAGGQLTGTAIKPVTITPMDAAPWVDALLPWAPADGVSADDLQQFLARQGGTARTYYYSFPDTLPAYRDPSEAASFQPLTADQRADVAAALAYLGGIINLRFEEVADPAAYGPTANMMVFDNMHITPGLPFAAYATLPDGTPQGSDVRFFNSSPPDLSDTTWAPLLLGAIARALGMPDRDLLAATFSDTEIAALQAIYGPAPVSNADPVWPYDHHTISADHANFIWDGAGGAAILSAAGQTAPVTLHLEPGHWDYIGSQGASITSPGQVTINYGTRLEGLEGGLGNDLLVGSDGVYEQLYGGPGDDTLQGQGGEDLLVGGAGNDVIEGGGGNDAIFIDAGHDHVDGGEGIDRVFFDNLHANYTVERTAGGITVAPHGDGQDFADLTNAERLYFSNSAWAMDLDGNAGAVARIIGVAFGKPTLDNPVYVGTGLGLADSGMTDDQMSAYAIPYLLQQMHPGVTDGELVDLFYTHVVGAAPDAATRDYYVGLLDNSTFTRATLLSFAAQTDQAAAAIDLVGLTQTGLKIYATDGS
jgi:Ca2+-binding RTX toxin-like protein